MRDYSIAIGIVASAAALYLLPSWAVVLLSWAWATVGWRMSRIQLRIRNYSIALYGTSTLFSIVAYMLLGAIGFFPVIAGVLTVFFMWLWGAGLPVLVVDWQQRQARQRRRFDN